MCNCCYNIKTDLEFNSVHCTRQIMLQHISKLALLISYIMSIMHRNVIIILLLLLPIPLQLSAASLLQFCLTHYTLQFILYYRFYHTSKSVILSDFTTLHSKYVVWRLKPNLQPGVVCGQVQVDSSLVDRKCY